jgi:hypothetical protein
MPGRDYWTAWSQAKQNKFQVMQSRYVGHYASLKKAVEDAYEAGEEAGEKEKESGSGSCSGNDRGASSGRWITRYRASKAARRGGTGS